MKNNGQKIVNILLVIFMVTISLQLYNINNRITYIYKNTEYVEITNSPKRLNLKSVYGDNQAYHPKVISFKNKWNGYKYWMSYTPYPYGDSKKENPHVVASNDGINFKFPSNIKVLDEVKDTAKGKRYNSDSHLVYNEINNELECWWRYVDDVSGDVTLYRRVTTDGINWSSKEAVITANRKKQDYLSPAIIYEDNIYKIWFVRKNRVMYTESSDLKNFSKPIDLNIEYEDSVLSWHLDVIHTNKGYEMILVAYSDWEHRMYMNLYYTKSVDNKNYDIAKVILKPTTGTNNWNNSGLYRSSFIYEDGLYKVYYSGQGTNKAKGIGLVEGSSIFNLKTVKY